MLDAVVGSFVYTQRDFTRPHAGSGRPLEALASPPSLNSLACFRAAAGLAGLGCSPPAKRHARASGTFPGPPLTSGLVGPGALPVTGDGDTRVGGSRQRPHHSLREVPMYPIGQFSTPPPYRDGMACQNPGCGRILGVAEIVTLTLGIHRKAFYTCSACGRKWTEQWAHVDKAELIDADELLAVHDALAGWDGSLLDLLEVKPNG